MPGQPLTFLLSSKILPPERARLVFVFPDAFGVRQGAYGEKEHHRYHSGGYKNYPGAYQRAKLAEEAAVISELVTFVWMNQGDDSV